MNQKKEIVNILKALADEIDLDIVSAEDAVSRLLVVVCLINEQWQKEKGKEQ